MANQCDSSGFEQSGQNDLSHSFSLDWIEVAAGLPGKSFHVAVALWLLAAKENISTVPLSNKLISKFSVDRNAKYRALQWLENAGLISISQKVGKTPIVTILDIGK